MQGGSHTNPSPRGLVKTQMMGPEPDLRDPDTGHQNRACDFAFLASSRGAAGDGEISLREPPPLSLMLGVTHNCCDPQVLSIDSNGFVGVY